MSHTHFRGRTHPIGERERERDLVRHLPGEDLAGGDDGGERTGGEDVDGGETGRILGTDALRVLLVHHRLVRSRAAVVLLHARHETESHRAHDGRRVEADNLRARGE